MNYKLEEFIDLPDKDLWEYLVKSKRPIVLYGTGDGADKIIRTCQKYDLEISDIFASDNFFCKANGTRRYFHGKMIMSFSEIVEKYSRAPIQPIVLLSFATTLPSVINDISHVAERCELYVPDVPVVDEGLFNIEYVRDNEHEICLARELFCDDLSRKIYDLIILGRLTGDMQTILNASDDASLFKEIVRDTNITSCADLGAYDGDTAQELSNLTPDLKMMYLFEPDHKTFSKLLKRCDMIQDSFPDMKIEKYNIAAWSESSELIFAKKGSRGSMLLKCTGSVENCIKIETETSDVVTVKADSLDNILDGRNVDYIKYDVEGAEFEALEGSLKTIMNCAPIISLSLYHRPGDIFKLPLFLNEKFPFYTFFLRRKKCLPLWEINLYAVPKKV